AVLAAAVGVDAEVEADVGAVVGGDGRARRVVEVARARPEVVVGDLLGVELHLEPRVAVERVEPRAPAAVGVRVARPAAVLCRHTSDDKVSGATFGETACTPARE